MKALLSVLLVVVVFVGVFSLASSADAPSVYAELFFHNDSQEVMSVSQAGVYNNVSLFSRGDSNFLSFVGDNAINITYPGVYFVTHAESFGGAPNTEIHFAVGVNGVEQTDCHSARVIGTGGDVGNSGAHCILTLSLGDIITLMYENEDNAQDIDGQDLNLALTAIR